MTSRTLATVSLVAAGALALAGCAHPTRGTAGGQQNPASAGLGAIAASPSPSDAYGTATPSQGTGNGTGTGGGHHGSPSPSQWSTGPRIISFTATGAVCPVDAKPGAPYSKPGEVTVSWKISGATGVKLSMDHGLWGSYDTTEGTETLPFQCDNSKAQTVTHSFTLDTTGGSPAASKTITASAKSNPN